MGARVRDGGVVAVLVVGGIAATAAWHPLGRWVSLAVALAAVLIAAGVYRMRPSAFPWRDGADAVVGERREHVER